MKNDIDVHEQHEQLPSFYWLPKLHKKPYGARFIATSNTCTTKQLSSLLTSCFKTILIHYKQYCNGIYNHSGIICFWIINNPTEILDRLHSIFIIQIQVESSSVYKVVSSTESKSYTVTITPNRCIQRQCIPQCNGLECGYLCRHTAQCTCADYIHGHLCKHTQGTQVIFSMIY